jgi:hypothetical protein
MGCYVWLWFEESRIRGTSDVFEHIESKYSPEDFILTKHRPGVYEMTFWTPEPAWSVFLSVALEEFPPLLRLLLANPGQEHTTRSQLEEFQRTYPHIRIP